MEPPGQCTSESMDVEIHSVGLERNKSFWNRSDEYGFIPAHGPKDSRDVSCEELPAMRKPWPRSSSLRRGLDSVLETSPNKNIARVASSPGCSPLPTLPRPNVQQRTPSRQRAVRDVKLKCGALKHDRKNNVLDKIEHTENSRRVKPGQSESLWESTSKRCKSGTTERTLQKSQPWSPAKRDTASVRLSSSKPNSPAIDDCPSDRQDYMDAFELALEHSHLSSKPDMASVPTCSQIGGEAPAGWKEEDLKPCPHCRRTFLPDRLDVHLRSCRSHSPGPANICGKGDVASQHQLAPNLQQNAWLQRWTEEIY